MSPRPRYDGTLLKSKSVIDGALRLPREERARGTRVHRELGRSGGAGRGRPSASGSRASARRGGAGRGGARALGPRPEARHGASARGPPVRVAFRSDAADELAAAAEWYEAAGAGLGADFLGEALRSVAAILEGPTAWPVVIRTRNGRESLLWRFPCAVRYLPLEGEILVLAPPPRRRTSGRDPRSLSPRQRRGLEGSSPPLDVPRSPLTRPGDRLGVRRLDERGRGAPAPSPKPSDRGTATPLSAPAGRGDRAAPA